MSGSLSITYQEPNKHWKLRNTLRWGYIWGWLTTVVAKLFSRATGVPVLTSQLRMFYTYHGVTKDLGVVGRRVITTAGVNWLVDCLQGTYEPEIMKYHACGTGTTAESSTDTALVTECTEGGIIDATLCTGGTYRPAGSLEEGSSGNIFHTDAVIGFDGAGDITEHGVFTAASVGTLWDRTVFTAYTVADDGTLTFNYEMTLTAGG